MASTVIVNASPLIFLSRGHHLDLLQHFADRVVVPQPVANEVFRKGPDDTSAAALANTPWLEIITPPPIPAAILEWGLGSGESSVLSVAYLHDEAEVIIDDLAARRCADALCIPVRGTLGIVLAARQRGIVPSARAVMEDLIQGGMYLSRDVLNAALSRVGE